MQPQPSTLIGRESLRGELSQRLATEPGVVVAYLFGSVARGTDGARSDVDVGVLLDRDPPRTLGGLHLDLEADLQDVAGRRVQLVVLNRAPVDLIHRVLRDGILLLDCDPSTRIRFEVKSRNEYFDLLPVLQRYRRTKAASWPKQSSSPRNSRAALIEPSLTTSEGALAGSCLKRYQAPTHELYRGSLTRPRCYHLSA